MEELSDQEIIARFKRDETRNYAFNILVRTYQERLYWHIRRMVIAHEDADDLLQNVFMKAFQHLANFRSESALYTWLYRIATNECLSFLNSKRRKLFIPWSNVEKQLNATMAGESAPSATKIEMRLQHALLTLPTKQRLVFLLKYYDEMKYEEMSEVLGTSVGALKASYHHAVKKIEEYLNTH